MFVRMSIKYSLFKKKGKKRVNGSFMYQRKHSWSRLPHQKHGWFCGNGKTQSLPLHDTFFLLRGGTWPYMVNENLKLEFNVWTKKKSVGKTLPSVLWLILCVFSCSHMYTCRRHYLLSLCILTNLLQAPLQDLTFLDSVSKQHSSSLCFNRRYFTGRSLLKQDNYPVNFIDITCNTTISSQSKIPMSISRPPVLLMNFHSRSDYFCCLSCLLKHFYFDLTCVKY